ncbi:MAG: hypothetical protein ACXIUO_13720 [Erythrobacter sp.]
MQLLPLAKPQFGGLEIDERSEGRPERAHAYRTRWPELLKLEKVRLTVPLEQARGYAAFVLDQDFPIALRSKHDWRLFGMGGRSQSHGGKSETGTTHQKTSGKASPYRRFVSVKSLLE